MPALQITATWLHFESAVIDRRYSTLLAPTAQDEAADCEADEGSSHVYKNKRPGISFESGKDSDRRVLDEKKREPADKSDLQTGHGIGRV